MWRLTREIRLIIGASASDEASSGDGWSGRPGFENLGDRLVLIRATLAGSPDAATDYVRNIQEVDRAVYRIARPLLVQAIAQQRPGHELPRVIFQALRDAWPGATLDRLSVHPTPFVSFEARRREIPMVRFSHQFEFSAAHRLHNPHLDDQANVHAFGKCNNLHGHGHNYELEVMLLGEPNESGVVIDPERLRRIVQQRVVDPMDHKFLNLEVPQFAQLNPSVENIARVIFELLVDATDAETRPRARLASVTVWETPKTWCEYIAPDLADQA